MNTSESLKKLLESNTNLLCITSCVFILITVILYRPEWVLFLIFIAAAGIAISLSISAFIGAYVNSMSLKKSQRSVVKSQPDLEALRKFLTQVELKPPKPKRLPVIFGRMIDDTLQQLLDLILRDFVCNNLVSMGLGTNGLAQDIKEDIWKVIAKLQERISKVDLTKIVALDLITKVTHHFEMIRLVEISRNSENPLKYEVHQHLSSPEMELNYLRKFLDFVMDLLFPAGYVELPPVKHLLRELLVCKVLLPTVEIVTDPDYINQKILCYIQQQSETETLRRKSYSPPQSFEDFIKLIKEATNPEELKLIRYDIVTEIIQATKIQSLKGSRSFDQTRDIFSHLGGKIDLGVKLQARQMKRYLNQLTYAKTQCEKRLVYLGWTDYAVEEAVEATTFEGKKMALHEVLDSVVGREYLMKFLDQVGSKYLLNYFNSVEELRQAKRCERHQLGTEIFYTYINTPSPEIKVDKLIQKRMEAFLLGDRGPEVFYEVQDQVLMNLEEKLFPAFLVSDVYHEMLLAIEKGGESDVSEATYINSNGPSGVDCTNDDHLQVVEQSNYARKKLDALEEKLNNKMQALEALRSSLKPESKVLSSLENEVELLQGEKRQLEAHLTRTETWSEHLGQWRAVVQSAELSDDRECPQFVLVVHVLEDEMDSDAVSTGWVVLRKLSDFQELHRKLCQLNSKVKNLELPTQSLKFLKFGKGTVKNFLEKARLQIQKYLQFILEDERLNQSEALYAFLSPSSEHLKQIIPSPKKSKFSLSTLFKSVAPDLNSDSTITSTGRDSDEEVTLLLDESNDSKIAVNADTSAVDGIAEPLYNLLEELFDPGMFRWLRKTLITFVQITYNKTINRQVAETVSWIFSESMIYYYIQLSIKAWWPNDKLVEPPPLRTENQKMETRSAAKEQLLNNVPDFLSSLVGHQCAQRGIIRMFDALQDNKLNKRLLYEIFEIIVHELCPEWKDIS